MQRQHAELRFDPSEQFEGLTRTVVMLGPQCVGTIAEMRGGTHEFIPQRGVRLPPGPHVAKTAAAIGRLVRELLAGLEPPTPPPRYVAVRPDGTAWNRPFATPAAAWRAIVGGTRGTRERRQDRAALEQAGWRVRAESARTTQ